MPISFIAPTFIGKVPQDLYHTGYFEYEEKGTHGRMLYAYYAFKDLCVVTVYTCLKIYLYKKALFIFVNNVTFLACFIMGLLNILQISVYRIVKGVVSSEQVSHFSVTSGLKSSDPFIFLSFLKNIYMSEFLM